MKITILCLMIICSNFTFSMESEKMTAVANMPIENDWHFLASLLIDSFKKNYEISRERFLADECQMESGLAFEIQDTPIVFALHTPIGTWKADARRKDHKLVNLPVRIKKYEGDCNDSLKTALIRNGNTYLYSIESIDQLCCPETKFKQKENFLSLAESLQQWAAFIKNSQNYKELADALKTMIDAEKRLDIVEKQLDARGLKRSESSNAQKENKEASQKLDVATQKKIEEAKNAVAEIEKRLDIGQKLFSSQQPSKRSESNIDDKQG